MPLTTPAIAPVIPGQPVTAQGWNELVSGLLDLYSAVLAFGTGALTVDVRFNGAAVGGASVVAVPDAEGQPVRAVDPFGGRTTHTVVGLSDGNWTVHVRAPGFADRAVPVTVPRVDPLVVELERRGVEVPDLFGVGLRAATDQLRAAGLDTDLVFDTTGKELPRATVPPEYVEAPVLVQDPAPGAVAAPDRLRVRLVIASPLRRDPVVTVPSLVGLSVSEATRVLERLGLTVGTTTFQSL
jgi:hypothetical protein